MGREGLAAPGEGVIGAALLSSVVNASSFAAAGELPFMRGIVALAVLDASAPKCEVNTVLNKGV